MIDPFSSAGYETLLSYFVDLGAKSTLLLVAASCVDSLLGRQRVLVRSTVWHATLAALAVLPLATVCLPRLALSRPTPQAETSVTELSKVEIAAFAPATTTTSLRPRGDDRLAATISPDAPARRWEPVVFRGSLAVYFFGSLAVLVRLAASLRAVAALRAEPVEDERWNALVAQWSRRLGVAPRVRLLVSPEVSVPVQVGWLRPGILLPPGVAASTDEATRAAVLVHELAHVRRGDYGWNLLLRALFVLYWPHPLAWFAGRQIGQLREQACDELCVHWLGGVYRCRLMELAARLLSPRPLVSLGIAMSQPTKLARRLAWIDASSGRANCLQPAPARRAITIATLCLTGLLGAASVSDSAQERTSKAKTTQEPADQGEARKKPVGLSTRPAVADERSQSTAKAPADKADASRNAIDEAPADVGQADEADTAKPLRVRVERVKRQDFTVEVSQPCTLKAGRTSDVYARIPGYVKQMTVDIGDHVNAGQVLAELESLLGPEVVQAESKVAEGEAEFHKAEAVVAETKAQLDAAQADVDTAEADLEGAAVKLTYREKQQARIKRLAETGQIEATLVDEQEEKLWEAKAGVKGAKSALESARRLIRQREAAIDSAQATSKVAAARLRVAQVRLADVKKQHTESVQVVSPLDGVVVERNVHVGEFVAEAGKNRPAFTIANLRRMTAVTQIPQQEALRIKRGASARIFIDALRGKAFSATVSRVAYQIDPTTRTLQVDLVLDNENSEDKLLPGLYGAVAVATAVHRDAISVPLSTFQNPSLSVVVAGRAVQKQVETGARSFDRVEVVSGLKEGDIVITGLADPKQEQPDWHQDPRVEIVDSSREQPGDD
jgi:multidrug efflux pump subunit AcrA (membrane-fusion protein)/beta-lactamase regulating signal transducer with metallopeptidase domain